MKHSMQSFKRRGTHAYMQHTWEWEIYTILTESHRSAQNTQDLHFSIGLFIQPMKHNLQNIRAEKKTAAKVSQHYLVKKQGIQNYIL